MCGIAGFLSPDNVISEDTLKSMANALRHRGPDGDGLWRDPDAGIGLAHRRLAVVDLSVAGAQPMCSDNGRWLIAFNGEIYNHQELRRELDASRTKVWRGHSDTEVLLAAFAHWGVDQTLQRVNGMFALALWDRQERKLYLARDQMGEKPLYLAWLPNGIAFASELKAFIHLPGFKAEIDRSAIALLLRYGYVPTPHVIYRDVFKLPQGCYIVLDRTLALRALDTQEFLSLKRPFWQLLNVATDGMQQALSTDLHQAKQLLDTQLRKSVALRMLADVPVGAFLSGGIDSSIIVALMQAQSSHPVRTFTIGFDESDYDESRYAEIVARHLGTEHLTVRFGPDAARDRLPDIATLYDEPFADSSQLPTAMLAEVTRQHVTVSLSGDGGDELFFGYDRYFNALKFWSLYRRIPMCWRAAGTAILEPISHWFPNRSRRIQRFVQSFNGRNANDVHTALASIWPKPEHMVIGLEPDYHDACAGFSFPESMREDELRMMFYDQKCYLPDNLMVKTDRASMAVALEARMPFLDPNVIALSWQIPFELKVRGGMGKWLLREMLADYLPRGLFDRPKKGFNAPIGPWLRGPLREWAEDLLAENRLRDEGYFHPQLVRDVWHLHLNGRDESSALWAVLAFQSWFAHQ